jgi:hypothetical protein
MTLYQFQPLVAYHKQNLNNAFELLIHREYNLTVYCV